MQNVGLSVGYDYDIPMNEVIDLISKAGFDAISITHCID